MKKNYFPILIILFSIIGYRNSLACSGVYIATGEIKLMGLNEDFYDYNTIYCTLPGTATTYGIIGFGHSNSIQAIVNEKGLCYDGYGAPEKEVTINKNLPPNNGSFIFEAMTTCKNVEEVAFLYNKNYHPWLSNGQVFFTDRNGNSVIIEGDTLIYKSGDFQICTNFYQSDPESGIPYGFYPCQRYNLLKNELENTEEYSLEFLKGLLDSVHVENQESPHGLISSVYSLIIDLNENKIHVYNLYDFENPLVLDITEELNKNAQNKSLNTLFLTNVHDEELTPSKFILNQDYPNPFNPNTTIGYFLPEASAINITI